MPDCLFCKIGNGTLASDTVYEDDAVRVFKDKFPSAPVHLLVIPKIHIQSIAHLEDDHGDIVSRIIYTAKRVAEEHGATRVLGVDLLIGQLTFLNPRQVRLCYEILTRGTPLEGSELSIQDGEGMVRCADCQHERAVSVQMDDPEGWTQPLPLFSCSECGGKVEIVKGKECQVTGVTLEDL